MGKKKEVVYTVEVAGAPDVAGEGKPRRVAVAKDKLIDGVEVLGVSSLFENFENGLKLSGDKNCLGRRPVVDGVAKPFVWETYKQVRDRIVNIGSALSTRGLKKGDMLGIFAINRPEWVITEQAGNAYGYTLVPLYDTLGPEAIEFIITETEMKFMVASNDKLEGLIKDRAKYPSLQTVALLDGASDVEKEKGKGAELDIVSFAELEAEGKASPVPTVKSSPDDIATIMYTSGTTGLPKGVMLTHRNFISDAAAVATLGKLGVGFSLDKTDVHLSYLPMAHVFERMVVTYLIGVGAAIGFFQGSPLKLLDDLAVLKPTLFPSVPRLLNRIYDKIIAAVELKGGVSASLFHMAVQSKRVGLQHGKLDHWLWDKLVFGKVKAKLGGRVQLIATGSAPISPEVLSFLRLAFCCEVYEAYGQTESCAGSSMTLKGDYEAGHIGVPFPCNEIKLVDVPEMNYTSKDQPLPRGEICFRGTNVFKGYYKNEEKTKEALDADGWLHSGDIGLWDEKGRLKIIDRKKNIFKLAQGEYIAPEKIENVYCKSKYVAQAFVYGDSLKAFLVAVVILDEETLAPFLKQHNITSKMEEYKNDERLKEMVLKDMVKVGKELGLKSFEQVKDIFIDHELFSVENNLLTPTFKLKRPQAKEHYQKELDTMIDKVQKAEGEKEHQQNLAEEKAKAEKS